MRSIIDWMSFTIPYRRTGEVSAFITDDISEAIHNWLGELAAPFMNQTEWLPTSSRAPYAMAWQGFDKGATIFGGGQPDTILIEISGKGCDLLRQIGIETEVLNLAADRLTRIDLACDIRTDTQPDEFVAAGRSERFKSVSNAISPTGSTCYVGSKASDAYARVYRWNAPHPRHELLRVEHVYRKETAKLVGRYVLEHGMLAAVFASGKKFGWRSSEWKPESSNAPELASYRPERREGKTVRWLVASVAPAFRRLVASGVIDNPQRFLEEHFLNGLEGF